MITCKQFVETGAMGLEKWAVIEYRLFGVLIFRAKTRIKGD